MQNQFKKYKWLVLGFLILGFLGFLDATYLTVKHYLGTPINCSIFEGCEKVTTSQYATVGGVPVSVARGNVLSRNLSFDNCLL